MLKQKNIPHSFWGEAAMTIAHVLNRCPTKRLDSIVLEEAWSGNKPSAKHFKIFGSLCYRHILDQRRKKLDEKSEPMIFVGYTKQVLFSRDVYFDESNSWGESQPITEIIPKIAV